MKSRCTSLLLAGSVVLINGCAHYPVNAPLAQYDPDAGYRFKNLAHEGNSDSLQIFTAL